MTKRAPIGGSADWAVRAEAEGEGGSTVGACLRDLGECGGRWALYSAACYFWGSMSIAQPSVSRVCCASAKCIVHVRRGLSLCVEGTPSRSR
eukprot:4241227-Prymnesium_polylepis.1